jgi:Flp pilus assembly pilin Flp
MNRAGFASPLGGGQGGQALVEYALVLAVLSAFCIAVLTPYGEPLRNLYAYIINALAMAAASAAGRV